MKTKAHNLDIDIEHKVEASNGGLTVIKVSAVCGQTTHVHSITVGAIDGKRPAPPTKQDLQQMLDEGRNHAANEAAWKESARLAASQLS